MREKPLIFNLYAIIFGVIVVAMPLQITYLYGHQLNELGAILNKLTLFNYLVMAIALANIYLCAKASEHLKWSLPLSAAIVCINNSVVMIYGNDFESYNIIISTLVYFSLVALFYIASETKIIDTPEKQWWRIPTRQNVREKVLISNNTFDIDLGETFDLSVSGAFICNSADSFELNLRSGDIIDIVIGEEDQIHVKAKIVRKAKPRGHYPSGIGIQFVDMSLLDNIKLRHKLYTNHNHLAA